jgi:acetyl esterase/lipase
MLGKPLKDTNRTAGDVDAVIRHLRALQRFVAAARARQLPVTLIEHAEAPHAFDLEDDSPRTRAVIEEVLAFLRRTLA